jgi:hypothetical protein
LTIFEREEEEHQQVQINQQEKYQPNRTTTGAALIAVVQIVITILERHNAKNKRFFAGSSMEKAFFTASERCFWCDQTKFLFS